MFRPFCAGCSRCGLPSRSTWRLETEDVRHRSNPCRAVLSRDAEKEGPPPQIRFGVRPGIALQTCLCQAPLGPSWRTPLLVSAYPQTGCSRKEVVFRTLRFRRGRRAVVTNDARGWVEGFVPGSHPSSATTNFGQSCPKDNPV